MSAADQEAFDTNRNLLFSIAYRILGTATDAEDAVQDTGLKWSAADRDAVAEPKAYLARIVSNVAMDRLRSAHATRVTYVGPWLPEPILTDSDATERVSDAESVSMAMLVVLETLSPLERAVFVLREVFAFSYAEIAEAIDSSEAAVRQAGHRARGHVQSRRPRFIPDKSQHRRVMEQFFAAAAGDDINTLMSLLSPDVTLWTDGGGKVRQAMRPLTGAEKVASWFAGISRRPYQGVDLSDMTVEVVDINGFAGVVISGAGRVIATITVDLDADGRIAGIHNVANPDKLRAITEGRRLDLTQG